MENSSQQIGTMDAAGRARSLSDLLDQVDSRLGKMEAGSAGQGMPILLEMDAIYHRIQKFSGPEDALKAEKTQFEYIQTALRRNMALLLRQVGGAQQLQAERAARQPGPDQWWWQIDALLAEQRRSGIRRLVTSLAGAAAVILVLIVVYRAFLAPDPQTIAVLNHQRQAEAHLIQGNYEQAVVEIDQALEIDPNNTSLLIMKAVGLETYGQEEAAAETFGRAERLFPTRQDFLLQKALIYIQYDQPEKALPETNEVIELDPQSAIGHYYQAIALEALGDFKPALEAYDMAFELANEQDQTQLAATIRVNMGMLMQSMPSVFTPESPEPVEE